MSSDKDIIGKADVLMRRTAAGTETGAFPVLTDIVGDGARAAAIAEQPSELARDIFDRVMVEVETRFAADLERRLTQHLIPEVHTAVASALGDLHQELANAIGDAVMRALENRLPK